MISADKILKTPENKPEMLFDKRDVKGQFRRISKQWHPDVNKNPISSDVFNHLNKLYHAALDKKVKGVWETPFHATIKADSGQYNIRYKYMFDFVLGKCYVCDTVLVYLIDNKYEDMFYNSVHQMTHFEYKSDRMEKEMSRFLPDVKLTGKGDDYFVLVINKTKDVVPLSGILSLYNGKIDPKHVCWIISGLYNIGCYMEVAGITHNDISIDNVFISYTNHSCLLLGGWWYSVPKGDKLMSVPVRSYNLMTESHKDTKTGEFQLDVSCINSIGMQLLGNTDGAELRMNKDIPVPLIDWFMSGGSGKGCIKDYGIWMNKILTDSYGKRKFVKLDTTNDKIYESLNKKE